MNLIFFYKCSKFYLDFEKRIKFAKNVDAFEEKLV